MSVRRKRISAVPRNRIGTGKLLVSTTPTSSARSWKEQDVNFGQSCDPGGCDQLGGTFWDVSCADRGAGLCVAVGDGDLAASSNPTGGTRAWPVTAIDAGHSFTGVSCTRAGLCAAVDNAGRVATSTDPSRGATAWHVVDIDHHRRLSDVACVGAHFCAATDAHGDILTSADPAAGHPSWQIMRVDRYPLTSITCPSPGTCLAVDDHGRLIRGGIAHR